MNKNIKIEEIIWRYFDKKASDEDIKAISFWLDTSKDNLRSFATMKKAFIEIEANTSSDNEQIDQAFVKFLSSIERVEKQP